MPGEASLFVIGHVISLHHCLPSSISTSNVLEKESHKLDTTYSGKVEYSGGRLLRFSGYWGTANLSPNLFSLLFSPCLHTCTCLCTSRSVYTQPYPLGEPQAAYLLFLLANKLNIQYWEHICSSWLLRLKNSFLKFSDNAGCESSIF